MSEQIAAPKFSRGKAVHYVDRQGRLQRGKVLSIEANWPGYSKAGVAPYFIYSVEHPTYHNHHMYLGEDALS